MRSGQTLVLILMFVAVVGTVFVALIIKSNGPPEIYQELTPSQFASKPIVVLPNIRSSDFNTEEEPDDETEPVSQRCPIRLIIESSTPFSIDSNCHAIPCRFAVMESIRRMEYGHRN